jgi:hypothetical protein
MVTARARCFGSVAAMMVLTASGRAGAQETPQDMPPSPEAKATSAATALRDAPRVHHAPVSSAKAHEDLRILAAIDHAERLRAASVVYRTTRGDIKVVPLLRADAPDATHVGVIPAEDVLAPGIAYSIEVERRDGPREATFAARDDMHPVLVIDDHMDVRERAALKRLGSRRSLVTATGEYASFGSSCGGSSTCAPGQTPAADYFWRAEAGYTYRPLRTVSEFGIKIGVVRGDVGKGTVGINYAEPWVRFRMADAWHIEFAVITSVTEIGFSIGGGTALVMGDPYGTRLTLGAEEVGFSSTYFGSRMYARLDILVKEGITVGPAIEVTDMPHASSFGVRLVGDASVALPRGFAIGARAGYQARRSVSGGVGLGGTLSYAF